MIPNRRQSEILAIVLSVSLGLRVAGAQEEEAQALQAVESELRTLEERLENQQAEREAELLVLREAELSTAAATDALRSVRGELAIQRERQDALAEDSRLAGSRLDGERDVLAQQIRMSYMAGRQEAIKLLLNQESPAALGRMVVYYDYLNQARSERVNAVTTELEHLSRLEAESAAVAGELVRLEEAQSVEVNALEAARDDRREVLARVEQSIESSGQQIQVRREEAQRLQELVAELRRKRGAFQQGSGEEFSAVKGDLSWPLAGQLINDFGQPRAGGQMKWNGVVLGAPSGMPVNAIHYGRVIYADWLPGLGLLVIVDHGSGFMSLYGHNEALLKESGDWVVPGEAIAHVGDSGGQAETALYFEIRSDGEPIDPRPWMAGRPGASAP